MLGAAFLLLHKKHYSRLSRSPAFTPSQDALSRANWGTGFFDAVLVQAHLLQCRGSSALGEPEAADVPESSTQMHPLSPRASSQFSPRPGVSRTISGITTASHDAGMIGRAVPERDGFSGGATGPITPEQMPSVIASDASVDYGRLKEENSTLSQK